MTNEVQLLKGSTMPAKGLPLTHTRSQQSVIPGLDVTSNQFHRAIGSADILASDQQRLWKVAVVDSNYATS
jgi:hypothetical protein